MTATAAETAERAEPAGAAPPARMRIGDLARQTGASVRALRYYEEQGLLTAERSPSGQRYYRPGEVDRVRLIRQLYAAGLNSATIATLMPCVDTPSEAVTARTIALMRREQERIDEQIAVMVAIRGHLNDMVAAAMMCSEVQDPVPATSSLAG